MENYTVIIMGQDKDIAISTDCFVSFSIERRSYQGDEESFFVIIASRGNEDPNCAELAFYNNGDFAQAEYERMIDAWSKGESYYELPLEE